MAISGTIGRNQASSAPARGLAALAFGLAIAGHAPDARAQLACGDLVPPGTSATLTADVGPCDGTDAAIVVDAATLDLGGRTVSCADTDGDGGVPDGVVLLGKKAAVRNGTIAGCDDGVLVLGAGKHTLEGVTVAGAAEDGIWVDADTPKNRFVANTVRGNGDDGFEVRSDRNTIAGNVALLNGEDGIDVVETRGNKIASNTSSGNLDEGIDVNGIGNRVIGNTVEDNAGYGIAVVGRRNKVVGNTASGSGSGQDIAGPDCRANTWKKNTIASPSACVP
jgi:parallel beta-helix repeat protein